MTARRSMKSLGVTLVATLLAAGCAEEVVLDGAGLACLTGTAGWSEDFQSFATGAPVFITVRLSQCLSSSCTSDRQASCEVLVTGDRIEISAQGGYTDASGASRTCTDDCILLDAACETPPLDEGTYTVVYGDEELTLGIPSVTGAYCVPQRI